MLGQTEDFYHYEKKLKDINRFLTIKSGWKGSIINQDTKNVFWNSKGGVYIKNCFEYIKLKSQRIGRWQ